MANDKLRAIKRKPATESAASDKSDTSTMIRQKIAQSKRIEDIMSSPEKKAAFAKSVAASLGVKSSAVMRVLNAKQK